MLDEEGEDRTQAADLRLACLLAGVAGALNTAGFRAAGYFTANMTGNVSLVSHEFALGNILLGLFYLTIVILFVAGALASSLLINAGRRRHGRSIYAYSILAEALLLFILGCADLWLEAVHSGPIFILGLSFVMGLQNAIVTRISNARIRTTHISGMATDIGIELGKLLDIRLGKSPQSDKAPNLAKLWLHSWTVAAFLLGGIIGVAIYDEIGGLLLLCAAALLFAIALPPIGEERSA
ncbi:YoaK family protein [Rhodoligotrophos ferricapiens]|uniref:YoaK family protein n=1 Tax=Rhodoligotrophos ferricapiens TaxID=3069264 RepID=UPI00315C8398